MTEPCKQCANPNLKGIHTCGLDDSPHARIRALKAENAMLKEALRFYADPGTYRRPLVNVGPYPIAKDSGKTAREALEE